MRTLKECPHYHKQLKMVHKVVLFTYLLNKITENFEISKSFKYAKTIAC